MAGVLCPVWAPSAELEDPECIHSCIQYLFIKHLLCARPGTIAVDQTSVVPTVMTHFEGRGYHPT